MIVTKGFGGALVTKGFNNGKLWREVMRLISRIAPTMALKSYLSKKVS